MKKADLKTIKVLPATVTKLNKYAAAYNITQYEAAELASTMASNILELSLKPFYEQIQQRSDEIELYVTNGQATNPKWDNETFHKWLKVKNKAISTYKKATQLALEAAAIK